MAPDPLQILAQPRFERLWRVVRAQLERRPDARSISLAGFTAAELEALRSLLNEPLPRAPSKRLKLAQLDAALRQTAADMPLHGVLEALGGPLRDHRAERAARAQARDTLWQTARRRHPRQGELIARLRRSGALARCVSGLQEEAALLEQALTMAERLPERGVLLQELAADLTGSTHGLDPDQPLGRLALRILAWQRELDTVPAFASGRRRLWSEAGVRCEALSSHVLCLGLAPVGDDRLSRVLRDACDASEPQRLTLRELRGTALQLPAAQKVYICENPGVVSEAAAQQCSAPLICTEGVPSEAAMTLLRQLAVSSQLYFQADFDAAGIRIGSLLATRLGALPWRMSPADYIDALKHIEEQWPLKEPPGPAAWSAELHQVMQRRGVSIFEEQLLEILIQELHPRA